MISKKYESLTYSAVGLVALFLLLVAFNYLASSSALRADLTEGKIYTLAEGTKKILRDLSSPVKLKLYVSQGESVPVQLRSFADRVEDTLREFKSVAGTNLVFERYDPRPDSDEEDAAQIDGIEPQRLFNGETFYLGVTVSKLDRKQTIGAISPQRERLLEYDLARAVARVGSPERPTIGLMAGLPILGQKFNPMTRRSSEPWVLASELKREYEVKEIPLTTREIDKSIKVLLLIHPRDIQPATEYALDQFVLRGGKLIAFIDPYAFFDQAPPPFPGAPALASSSTLPTLLKAWGLKMDPGKVISDVVYASGTGPRYTPTVLTLNRNSLSRDDVVTSQIETLLYAFGGAFDFIKDGKPADGLTALTLASTSPNSMLVDNALASKAGDEATRNFQPGGRKLPLALRLSGKFRTAFPAGAPAEKSSGAKPAAGKPAVAAESAALTQSDTDNAVILVADADMLADGAAVDVQEVLGRKIIVPSNGNLALALGMIEQVAAGDQLMSLRTRASAFRPLTVVRELEVEAQKQYFGQVRALEDEVKKTSEKLESLQKTGGPASNSGQVILSPEQQAEIERFRKSVAQSRKALKDVRKNLRRDSESLVFWTKIVNIALMPLLVALLGIAVAIARRARTRRMAAA